MEAHSDKNNSFEEVSELDKNGMESAVEQTRKMLTGWRIKTKRKRFRPQNIQGMFTT